MPHESDAAAGLARNEPMQRKNTELQPIISGQDDPDDGVELLDLARLRTTSVDEEDVEEFNDKEDSGNDNNSADI